MEASNSYFLVKKCYAKSLLDSPDSLLEDLICKVKKIRHLRQYSKHKHKKMPALENELIPNITKK